MLVQTYSPLEACLLQGAKEGQAVREKEAAYSTLEKGPDVDRQAELPRIPSEGPALKDELWMTRPCTRSTFTP